METTVLLEKKLKGYSVAQLKSKLQRGCPENEKAICLGILKKRNEDTSKWEAPNEKLGVFINEDIELTPEEVEIVEKAEIAHEKTQKTKLSQLKDILKETAPKIEKPKTKEVTIESKKEISFEFGGQNYTLPVIKKFSNRGLTYFKVNIDGKNRDINSKNVK
jgi:hypothetical protein